MIGVDAARWRLRRLSKMSPAEVAWRLSDRARQWAWSPSQVSPGTPITSLGGAPWTRQLPPQALAQRSFTATLPPGALDAVPDDVRLGVVAAADELLAGRWEVLGVPRQDLASPDWFLDPVTGKRAPQGDYCFGVDHRSEDVTGNVKQLWELSRHHHLTLLAAAFAFSEDDRYAQRAASHLRSWWAENPFLSGVHWTSGIEIGMRLVAWVWVRRLLDAWGEAADLFERNPAALAQVWWHQRYLAGFRSRGSSSNNHVVAEAAGQLVAALAFPWFDRSSRWADDAAGLLESELSANTFPSGVNREQAFAYHGFVLELGLVAAAEAARAGRPLGEPTWQLLCSMADVVAATADARLQAPRHGDGDDGRALVLDPSGANRWASLLAAGGAVFGAPAWWPAGAPDATSTLVASMAGRRRPTPRPRCRPSHYADAGLVILRSGPHEGPEIWCRCDGGPHGHLSIAAHAHADALGVEVRHGGREILVDPGTYCYHGEARWRRYFRSTLAHNTVELAGRDQSVSGGPFLWQHHARARLLELETVDGEVVTWAAEHDGYLSLQPPAEHRRTVRLRRDVRQLEIVDRVTTSGRHPLRLAFHLGPEVDAVLGAGAVELRWPDGRGSTDSGRLRLPDGLRWSAVRGSTEPVLGWYSARFGQRMPTTTVLGETACPGAIELRTVLEFDR